MWAVLLLKWSERCINWHLSKWFNFIVCNSWNLVAITDVHNVRMVVSAQSLPLCYTIEKSTPLVQSSSWFYYYYCKLQMFHIFKERGWTCPVRMKRRQLIKTMCWSQEIELISGHRFNNKGWAGAGVAHRSRYLVRKSGQKSKNRSCTLYCVLTFTWHGSFSLSNCIAQ